MLSEGCIDISSRHLTTTAFERIDFRKVGMRLHEPAVGQRTDDDESSLVHRNSILNSG